MKIKPILFSTPMVQAILDGRKSMTRRVVKPQPVDGFIDQHCGFLCERTHYGGHIINAPYTTGDVLWVRETWCNINKTGVEPEYYYRTDAEDAEDYDSTEWKWRPSIFMPREAARIWLRVTDVRVERVQDITPYDAWCEGCRIGNSYPWEQHIPDLQQMCRDILFHDLWDDLNAKRGYSWDSNPWVWAISFERCEKPQEGDTL